MFNWPRLRAGHSSFLCYSPVYYARKSVNEVIRITASQLAYYLTLCYREHSGKIPSVMHVFFKKNKNTAGYIF